MKLVPVSRENHRQKKVLARSSFEDIRATSVLPLFGAELARAAHEFPIGFIHDRNGYFPAALMAVHPNRNLFVSVDGQWLAGYLPAVLRRTPFALASVSETGNLVLCIDEDSPLLSDTDGNALFMEDDAPSPVIGEMTKFLVELERNRLVTTKACAAMATHGLLEPWTLRVAEQDGTQRPVEGLFKVREAGLVEVSAEGLVELRDTGALALAYAQLFSLIKLPILGRLAAVQAQFEAQKQSMNAASKAASVDLDQAFGIVGDDPFQFDFTK